MEKWSAYDVEQNLSEKELNVLYQIYLHRCFTLKQIHSNFLKDIYNFSEFLEKEKIWVENEIVEEIPFNNENLAIFLTKLGIDTVVNKFDLPKNIANNSFEKIREGYYRPSDLKMLPKAIPHQVHLNQFVLDFRRLYEYKNYEINYEYYDEKHVSMYSKIRPDGLIRILDTDFFIEEDMNTESKRQLYQKWEHYQSFLASNEYLKGSQKIIVLFIIDNTRQIENRKNLVKLTAYDTLFNNISDKFNIIVSTRESLMKMLFHLFIPNIFNNNKKMIDLKDILIKHDFLIDNGTLLKEQLGNKTFEYYIRKLDNDGNLLLEKNRFQEFIVDYYYPDSLLFIDKISYYTTVSNTFRFHFKRGISYILICDNLLSLKKDLNLFQLNNKEEIYFTTLERLNNYSFHKAICQFDISERLYCFEDASLTIRNFNIS